MALTDLGAILSEISALFDSLVADGDLAANLDHPPLTDELEGRSPVLSLHFDGDTTAFKARSSTTVNAAWVATVAVNRKAHGNAQAEILALGIVTKVKQQIRDAGPGTTFAEVALAARQSRPTFATVDGVPYRFIEIYLESVTYDQ